MKPIRKTVLSAGTLLCLFGMSATAFAANLPVRETPRPATTSGVPHVQIGVTSSPELTAEFLKQVAGLPGVKIRRTVISLPGAKGFWLDEKLPLAHPEVIVGGREFAHMHPDGSLHASLDPQIARQAVKAGWATPHPWSARRDGWEGFVMIYTPQNQKEMDVVMSLIAGSYEYVTGKKLPPR